MPVRESDFLLLMVLYTYFGRSVIKDLLVGINSISADREAKGRVYDST